MVLPPWLPKNSDLLPPVVVPAAVAETADMVDADYDSDNIPPSCEVVGSENVASCAAAAAAAVEHVDNCNSYHNAADD